MDDALHLWILYLCLSPLYALIMATHCRSCRRVSFLLLLWTAFVVGFPFIASYFIPKRDGWGAWDLIATMICFYPLATFGHFFVLSVLIGRGAESVFTRIWGHRMSAKKWLLRRIPV